MKLPEAVCRDAASLLGARHRDHLAEGETFTVDGETGPDGVEVVLVLEAPGGADRAETTCRVDVPAGAPDEDAALDRALDAADAFLGSWLEGGRAERHPGDFGEYDYEGATVHLRFHRSRPALDAEADRILRDAGDEPGEA